jgi:thiamine biosynthesis lipoprotein
MRAIIPASLVAVLMSVAMSGAAEPELKRFSFVEPHMGTKFKIILYAADESTASTAAKAAFARVAELDGIMSDYRPASELMQLCQKAGGEPVKVSEELFYVLKKAEEVSKASQGAFDITVGPVVKLWRQARKTKMLPDRAELAKALELVGCEKVRLNEKDRTVQLAKAGMQLDLGGIAKGYTADEVLLVLKKHGITRALCAAGGDIAMSEPPPGADGWTVGIAPLEDPDGRPSKFLLLKNAGVSTSGDAEQFVEIDGKRYSHIVDPKTGLGLVGRMSVTVVAPKGILSDSLTKTVCVLGPEKGMPLVEAVDGASVLMVRKTDKGEETIPSKHFPKLIEEK